MCVCVCVWCAIRLVARARPGSIRPTHPLRLFGALRHVVHHLHRVPPHVSLAIAAALALRVVVDGCVWLLLARCAGDD